MRLTNFLSSLLAASLLGASASAELTKVYRSSKLVTRDAEDYFKKLREECARRRSDDDDVKPPSAHVRRTQWEEVDIGQRKSGPAGSSLWTRGLGPCAGIAIVGDYPGGDSSDDAVWLSHVSPTESNDNAVQDVARDVQDAISKGLRVREGLILLMRPDTYPDDTNRSPKWNDDMRKALYDFNDEVINVIYGINDATGSIEPRVNMEDHSFSQTGRIYIYEDGDIQFDFNTHVDTEDKKDDPKKDDGKEDDGKEDDGKGDDGKEDDGDNSGGDGDYIPPGSNPPGAGPKIN